MIHRETIIYEWDEIEFSNDKSFTWYLVIGIISLLLIILAFYLRNYLFAFIIFVGAVVLSFMEGKEIHHVEISKHGIKSNDEVIPYEKIQSFWIGENELGKPILILKVQRAFHPIETLPVPEKMGIEKLRNTLLEYIEEEEMDEPLTNKIIHKLNS